MNLFTANMGWEIPASSCIFGERENPQRIPDYLAGDVISGGKENLIKFNKNHWLNDLFRIFFSFWVKISDYKITPNPHVAKETN